MSEPPPPIPTQPPPPDPGSRLWPPPDEAPAGAGGALPAVAWGPGRTLAALAGFLLALLLEGAVVIGLDGGDEDLGLVATLTLQATLAATMVAVAFVAARPGRGAAEPAALGIRRPVRPAVGAAVLAYLVYIGCALVLGLLLQPEQEDITRDLGFGEGVATSLAAGLLIVVAAPLSEELFFRGFMFAGLRRGMPFAAAALGSAGVWGLFHYTGPGSWGVVLQLTVFGIVLAWLYERTGSIWPPIAVHALNNAIAFAVLTS